MTETTRTSEKRNPLLYLFGMTWEYSKDNKKNVVAFWVMFITANAISLVLHPLILAKMFSVLQAQGVTSGNFWFLMQLLFANFLITFVFWGLHGPGRCKERANAYRVRGGYCKHLVRGLLTLPLQWHSEHHSGDTIDKIEKGRQGIYAFAAESFQPIFCGVRFVVSIVMLSIFSHSAGIITFIMIVVTILIVMQFDKKIMANYKLLNKADNLVSANIIDAISHISTIISLRAEKPVFESISQSIDASFPLYKATNRLNETKWFLVSACCALMWVTVLVFYFRNHMNVVGGVLIGSVFLLIRYLDEMSDLFYRFADMYSEVLQRQARVLNAEEMSRDFREVSFTNHVLPPQWKRIDVNNLHFTYKDAEGAISHLKDISFSINRGERIAFVGWSGSGKSTALKVFRDLHQPDKLSLSVDGVQITDGFAGIERDIALVQQKPEIFTSSIRKNLTMGVEHPEERIQHYLDMACFSKVVEGLPKGLESAINERGVNLSEGERQRLAVARALLASQGRSIILIDEPTSSVDEASKFQIYQNIFKEFKNSGIIFVTHELHLLPLFDRIYMFEKGQVVGSGTLEHLTKTCPEFRELCRHTTQERSS